MDQLDQGPHPDALRNDFCACQVSKSKALHQSRWTGNSAVVDQHEDVGLGAGGKDVACGQAALFIKSIPVQEDVCDKAMTLQLV